MGFGEAVKVCFSKMFVFSGRARRAEFWWFYLFITIISFVVSIVFMVIIFASMAPLFASADAYGNVSDEALIAWFLGSLTAYGLLFVLSAALSVMSLGVTARRLHDMGQTGHWLWLYLVGLGIVPVIMCIMEGQPYTNQWGPDPKAAERGAPGAVAAV